MKKMLALLLAVLMVLTALSALAEDKINCLTEEGSFIVQIDDPEGDMGWSAETKDDTIVSLYDADLIEDTFVVRFDPVKDGNATVVVKHFYNGFACDQVFTWDLTVKDGTIAEPTGGSHTASPDAEVNDAVVIGKWETENGMASMTVEKNPAGAAWDVEINGAASHSGYVFKATIYYDCEKNAFVYDKGKYWELPISDSEETPELGEPTTAGMTGSFTFAADGTLTWKGDDEGSLETVFKKAAAVSQEVIDRFSDTWAAEGFSAEIWYDNDAAAFKCNMALKDNSFCEFSDCRYDADTDTLVCEGGSRYNANFNEATADHDREILDSDVKAVFTVKDNTLTCEDSLGLCKGVVFEHLDDAEAAMAKEGK